MTLLSRNKYIAHNYQPIAMAFQEKNLEVLKQGNVLLPPYNTGDCNGPPPRQYITIGTADVEKEAHKKNLIWLLARLYSSKDQKMSG